MFDNILSGSVFYIFIGYTNLINHSILDKIEKLELSLNRQLTWVKAAESRISFIVTISTAMIGTIAFLAKKVDCWTWFQIGTGATATLLLSLSLFFAALAAFPRTKAPKDSLIYFGEISKKTPEEFSERVQQMDEKSYLKDLVSQCHRNAEIAQRKYYWIKNSIRSLLLATIPWIISIYILYN